MGALVLMQYFNEVLQSGCAGSFDSLAPCPCWTHGHSGYTNILLHKQENKPEHDVSSVSGGTHTPFWQVRLAGPFLLYAALQP